MRSAIQLLMNQASGTSIIAALALLLTDLGRTVDPRRMLVATSVYRGEPGRLSHRKLRAAFAQQTNRWHADPTVTVKTTPLRYRREVSSGATVWRAEEKGIDVLLAVDTVRGAYKDEYDTAVVASADTDLLPALEEILRAGKRAETASWSGPETGYSAFFVFPAAVSGATTSTADTSSEFKTPPTIWPDDGGFLMGWLSLSVSAHLHCSAGVPRLE